MFRWIGREGRSCCNWLRGVNSLWPYTGYCKSRIFRMHVIFVYFVRGGFCTKIKCMCKVQSKWENSQRSATVRKFHAYEGWRAQDTKIECVRNILDLQYFALIKVARNEVENASFAQRSAHHDSRIWRPELIEPAAERKRRARRRRPTFKSAYPDPQILPQCNISSNYPP